MQCLSQNCCFLSGTSFLGKCHVKASSIAMYLHTGCSLKNGHIWLKRTVHVQGSKTRELSAVQQGPTCTFEGHRLWAVSLLPPRPGLHRHCGQCLLCCPRGDTLFCLSCSLFQLHMAEAALQDLSPALYILLKFGDRCKQWICHHHSRGGLCLPWHSVWSCHWQFHHAEHSNLIHKQEPGCYSLIMLDIMGLKVSGLTQANNNVTMMSLCHESRVCASNGCRFQQN